MIDNVLRRASLALAVSGLSMGLGGCLGSSSNSVSHGPSLTSEAAPSIRMDVKISELMTEERAGFADAINARFSGLTSSARFGQGFCNLNIAAGILAESEADAKGICQMEFTRCSMAKPNAGGFTFEFKDADFERCELSSSVVLACFEEAAMLSEYLRDTNTIKCSDPHGSVKSFARSAQSLMSQDIDCEMVTSKCKGLMGLMGLTAIGEIINYIDEADPDHSSSAVISIEDVPADDG